MLTHSYYTRRLGATALGILLSMQTSCTNHSPLEAAEDGSPKDELYDAFSRSKSSGLKKYLLNQADTDQLMALIEQIKQSKLSDSEKETTLAEIKKVIQEQNSTEVQPLAPRVQAADVIRDLELKAEDKYKALKILHEDGLSSKEIATTIIEELEVASSDSRLCMYELLKRMCDEHIIPVKDIVDFLGEWHPGNAKYIYAALQNMYEQKVFSLPAMLQAMIQSDHIRVKHMKDLVEHTLSKSQFYKQDIISLKHHQEVASMPQIILGRHLDAQDEYDLLQMLHQSKLVSLSTILKAITKNRSVGREYNKSLLQYIFEGSKYYQSFIADLPESVLSTLQGIIDNHFPKAQEQKAFLKHVPETLKKKLKVAVQAHESKSLLQKTREKMKRTTSLILRKKSTTEGSPKADTV